MANAKTVEDIAKSPRWEDKLTEQLAVQCSGVTLKNWAHNVKRRWGTQAEQAIRDYLGPIHEQLPSAPTPDLWLPVSLQIRTTEAIIDLFLGGDPMALEPLLFEDIHSETDKKARLFLRMMGPARLLKNTPQVHTGIYNTGQAQADIKKKEATITVRGHELFTNPTWQLLQLFGQRIFLQLCNKQAKDTRGMTIGKDTFKMSLSWS